MKVSLARTAGFCMGVRLAMDMVLAEANKEDGPLYTLGPLIHNAQVMELLASKGVRVVDNLDEVEGGRVVIRAHGIPPDLRAAIKRRGLEIRDATCPRVAKVQAIIRYYSSKGRVCVIVGDRDHAEVIGLLGYSKNPAWVIQSPQEVQTLPEISRPFVVAQTTQNEENFRQVVNALRKRFPDLVVFETICEATRERQEEVRDFAGRVDGVVVVGGLHSGNTRRLAEVSREEGMTTLHVETAEDLDKRKVAGMDRIGVTAGASTPNWLIKDVVREIERIHARTERSLYQLLRQGFRFLVLSNLAVACGAFSFAHAASILCQRDPGWSFPFLSAAYIYAMHVLNRFLDKGASAYNDPEPASFLRRHRMLLVGTAVAGVAMGLVVAARLGLPTFAALCAMNLLGIVYSMPLVPAPRARKDRRVRIKDIPGSKSLSEALGWAVMMIILPLLDAGKIALTAVSISISVVFLMGYVRSALMEVLQVQGDRIVGTETLPIILGEKRTLALLKGILLATGLLLAGGRLLGLIDEGFLPFFLSLLALSVCVMGYDMRRMHAGIGLEALIEGSFFLAGLSAVLFRTLGWPL